MQPRKSVLAAIGLFFLAPLVAEYLLGDLPITMLSALVVLAPFYGGGALLIRELARRAGRGWPSIVLLALAFGILEEGFTTQSLFNPNYLSLNLHLLQPAYIPALGIGGWWTVFVLALHTVWSICVPIALVEATVPKRATTPWLGLAWALGCRCLVCAGGCGRYPGQLSQGSFCLLDWTIHCRGGGGSVAGVGCVQCAQYCWPTKHRICPESMVRWRAGADLRLGDSDDSAALGMVGRWRSSFRRSGHSGSGAHLGKARRVEHAAQTGAGRRRRARLCVA